MENAVPQHKGRGLPLASRYDERKPGGAGSTRGPDSVCGISFAGVIALACVQARELPTQHASGSRATAPGTLPAPSPQGGRRTGRQCMTRSGAGAPPPDGWTARVSWAVFFFSSRRRHTRFSRDWSSDVCSSDLPRRVPSDARSPQAMIHGYAAFAMNDGRKVSGIMAWGDRASEGTRRGRENGISIRDNYSLQRSEERRVGKVFRFRWWVE